MIQLCALQYNLKEHDSDVIPKRPSLSVPSALRTT